MRNQPVVIGGGVVGCAISAELANRGCEPIVLEAKAIAGGVSGASLAAIVQHLAGEVDELPFVIESAALWGEQADVLREEVGIDIELDVCGQLRLVERIGRDDGAAAAKDLADYVASERSAGLDVEMIDVATVQQLVPLLDTGLIAAASWCAGDAKVNALLACRALIAAARRRGADVRVGERVRELIPGRPWRIRTERRTIEADTVVVATGPWTSMLLAPLDERLAHAIVPKRAQCCATATLPRSIDPVISTVSVGISIGYTQLHQTRHGEVLFNTVVDSTEPRLSGGELDTSVDLSFMAASARSLRRLFPALESTSVLRAWGACEGWTRDHRFLLGPIPGYEGLLVAAGDSGTGFLRAPLIARLVGQLVAGEETSYNLERYSPTRDQLSAAP